MFHEISSLAHAHPFILAMIALAVGVALGLRLRDLNKPKSAIDPKLAKLLQEKAAAKKKAKDTAEATEHAQELLAEIAAPEPPKPAVPTAPATPAK